MDTTTFYTNQKSIQFLGSKSNHLRISKNSVWQIFSENAERNTISIIILGKTEKEFNKVTLSKAGFESLIELSKKTVNPFEEIFDENKEVTAWGKVVLQGALWLKEFEKQISQKSMAANYKEINKKFEEFKYNFDYLLNTKDDTTGKLGAKSLVNPSPKTKMALAFIHKLPELKLNQEDHGLKEGIFKHIKPLEEHYQKLLGKTVIGLEETERKYDIQNFERNLDNLGISLKIASSLQKGKVKKMFEERPSHQEGFSHALWNNLILNPSKWGTYEKEAQILLQNYELKQLVTQTKSARILKL